ncbi:MAG: hypothetical protein ACTSRH_17385 [Promethearchaeota archaeon]
MAYDKNTKIGDADITTLKKFKIIGDSIDEIISEQFLTLFEILKEKNVSYSRWFSWYMETDLDFKNLTSYSDVFEHKLKRLLDYVNKHDFSDLRKFVNGSIKHQEGHFIRKYVVEDLEKVIDLSKKVNFNIVESTEKELCDAIYQMAYLFMRLTNNIVYSEEGIEMDFHTYGSTLGLFKNILNEYFVDKYRCSPRIGEIFSIICRLKHKNSQVRVSEVKREITNCKEAMIALIDILTTLLQEDKREIAKRTIKGEVNSIESINTLRMLSTGNWCHIWVSEHSPADLNIILWQKRDRYFSLTSGSEKKFHKIFQVLNPCINAEGIAESVWMGTVTIDTSILISKGIEKLIEYGFLEHSNLIIPPTVYADLNYSLDTKVREKISLALKELETYVKGKGIVLEEVKDIPKWIAEELEKTHPSMRNNKIDSFYFRWAKMKKYTAIIGDRGNIADFDYQTQTFWLLPDGNEPILSSWNSFTEFFNFLKRTLDNVEINYQINEMGGIPLAYGKLNFDNWQCEINIQY